ncbi:hypothetical protein CF327_g5180 [Tilletia walkeri]|nr:hypothetical protein CF327_g5180 [Tilletia walkeri]
MPRYSERARLIKTLERYRNAIDLAVEDDDGWQDELDQAEELLGFVTSHRYLTRDRPAEDQRCRDSAARCRQLMDLNDDDFRRSFRATKDEFQRILGLIKDDNIFHTAKHRRQSPVLHQLLLVIWRLAHSGTGATLFHIAERFGVSEGTVVKWTDRVLCALIGIEKQFVWWPARGERQQLRTFLRDHHGLAGCVGFIDGTHINLANAPARRDAADFFNRHHRHSLNILAVVDFNLRFRFLHLGFPGSAHDQRVFNASALAQSPDTHFDANEFILGDSGYTPNAHLVSLFRRFRGLIQPALLSQTGGSRARFWGAEVEMAIVAGAADISETWRR